VSDQKTDQPATNTPSPAIDRTYTLNDRYTKESGRVFLTGIQALTRLPMVQKTLDEAAGLNTAGFISGYRGSPLGGYDLELTRARKFLGKHNVHFQPGLNEDLAATSVWGSQQIDMLGAKKVDGVFALWYGKGPGVDRCGDVFHHANAFGTARHGGALIVMGDDHFAQSSTISHQSEPSLITFGIPILNPSNVKEILEFGLAGFHLSRFSGCFVGLKCIAETVESGASVELDPSHYDFVTPSDFEGHPRGLNFDPTIKWPEERRIIEEISLSRVDAAKAWARANGFDKIVQDSPAARVGIVTTGKAYLDLRQLLSDLGIDQSTAEQIGLRIYKVGMTWPLEPEGLRRFAKGLERILVVEEKLPIIEDQIRNLFYHNPPTDRPVVTGKVNERNTKLLPIEGELSCAVLADPVVALLTPYAKDAGIDLPARMASLREADANERAPAPIARVPFYCSGCPHNTSTTVPEDSFALGGIGCHIMALSMGRNTKMFTQMGGEGANWIGMAPFTEQPHIFQNLGDGTYEHSGSLAIRAALYAGVNITYKILYNDAVAMTGGQPIAGQLTVPTIINTMKAEGVQRIAVVGDDVDENGSSKYGIAPDPAHGLTFHHRDDLEAVQRELRDHKGVSILIYDQTCAAEKRRRRKRGTMHDPERRVMINDLVCEGCGDCSVKSNCVSVEPLETELGRKRKINQSSCNKDYSCVKGFCPSFVYVEGGRLRKPDLDAVKEQEEAIFNGLPMVDLPALKPGGYNMLVTGIGGTGVVTIGALLSMAAHLEGKGASALDFTGLAQKNGAVMSHIRFAPHPDDLSAVRIADAQADLVLGCDMVVAAGADGLARVSRHRTHLIVNTHEAPTAGFTLDTTIDFPSAQTRNTLRRAAGEGKIEFCPATELAEKLFGDSIATNLFMVGVAWQRGLVPISLEAVLRAIELNGVAIDMNKRAFQWGRAFAHDEAVVRSFAKAADPDARDISEDLATLVKRRVDHLTGYQDAAYAARYEAMVERVRRAETALDPDASDLTEAVARFYFKLMAYKDEYEVARLHTDGRFFKRVADQFEGDVKMTYTMAPPLFAPKDPVTGHQRKIELPGWAMKPALSILAKLKVLRGSRLDIFGYTAERKMERRLIKDYEMILDEILKGLTKDNLSIAVQLARIPDEIRGFGHVKDANLAKAKAKEADLLKRFRAGPSEGFAEAAE